MSRGFCGSGNTSGSSISKGKGKSAKDAFMKRLKGVSDDNLDAKDQYEMAFKNRLAAIRKEAMKDKEDGQELSKSAEAILEQIAMNQAKKAQKKIKKKRIVEVKAKYFMGMQGGRIDGKGNIFGPDNKLIARVGKGGLMKDMITGTRIGKYSQSGFCEVKIARYIERKYAAQAAAQAAAAAPLVGGSVWGNDDTDGSNSFW